MCAMRTTASGARRDRNQVANNFFIFEAGQEPVASIAKGDVSIREVIVIADFHVPGVDVLGHCSRAGICVRSLLGGNALIGRIRLSVATRACGANRVLRLLRHPFLRVATRVDEVAGYGWRAERGVASRVVAVALKEV